MHKNYKVLIVEDIPSAQLCCEMALNLVGNIEAHKADSGEKAIDMFQANHYDLILMDIGLPGIDGIETARRIREIEPKHAPIYIVALTANEEASVKEDYFRVGMDDYISKPFTVEKAKLLAETYFK